MVERRCGGRWRGPVMETTHQDAPGSTIARLDDPRVHRFCITYGPAGRGEALWVGPAGSFVLALALAVL
jgi:hypothetical protein